MRVSCCTRARVRERQAVISSHREDQPDRAGLDRRAHTVTAKITTPRKTFPNALPSDCLTIIGSPPVIIPSSGIVGSLTASSPAAISKAPASPAAERARRMAQAPAAAGRVFPRPGYRRCQIRRARRKACRRGEERGQQAARPPPDPP